MEWLKTNGYGAIHKYEKTKKGFAMRLYRNMMNRVNGKTRKSHLWKGKPIVEKQDFYDWIFSQNAFHELFQSWEKSGYERRLTPSVDRIDNEKGYVFSNMRVVPFHINCGNTTRKRLSQFKNL